MEENLLLTYQQQALIAINSERFSQEIKWGKESNMVTDRGLREYMKTKLVVLMEEVGELSKEVLDWDDLNNLVTEAIQVAAVAQAIVEGSLYGVRNIEQAKPV